MPLPRPLPPAEYLRSLFDYNVATGVLSWRHRSECPSQWNGKWAGKPAGGPSKSNGRLVVNIGRRLFLCHRIVWKIVHGSDPDGDLDHKDGNPTNNRIDNLRLATKHQNLRNSRLHKGKALPKGVSRHACGRLRASIYINGRCKHLGLFDSPDEAHAAYCSAATSAFGDFARFA